MSSSGRLGRRIFEERNVQRSHAEEAQQRECPGTGAIDDVEPNVPARLQMELARFPEQCVVRTEPMRAGGELARQAIAVHQRPEWRAIDRRDDLSLPHIVRMASGEGDTGGS